MRGDATSARSGSASDDEQDADYLHCDGLPMSCVVDLNLADVFSGSSDSFFTGTSNISFQIEAPTNCLFFHVDASKVQILSMKMQQGKHTLRPKCVYSGKSLSAPSLPAASSSSAAAAAASGSTDSSCGRRPFRWALEEQNAKQKKRGDPPKKMQGVAIALSEWKLPRLALSDGLRIVELAQPLSYCTVDLIFDFKCSLSEDYNGIWLSTSRTAGTMVQGRPLPQPAFLVATHFEVDHAHRCFPCVDLVYVRQTVQFNLSVPSNTYCRGNGGPATSAAAVAPAAAGTAPSTGIRKVQLPASVRPIPMYVAAFIASTIPMQEFKEFLKLPAQHAPHSSGTEKKKKAEDDIEDGDDDDDDDGNHCGNHSLAEEEVECSVLTTYDSPFMHEVALKTMTDSVKELRNFLHCTLDMPHLCLAALPKLILGGMENDGIIFIKESIGVSNQTMPGQGRRSVEAATKELVRFVVHEVAHHWVGNRIGFSFSWKEGITLVLERYFGNLLLGLPANQGSKGACGDDNHHHNHSAESGDATSSSSSSSAAAAAPIGSGGALVAVDSGKELSGMTYHKAEAAMETAVRKMGWAAFQAGMQRICRLPAGEVVPDSGIPAFFKS